MKVVKYLKSDRVPHGGGCYSPGDIAGWPDETARKLIAQGYAELFDAGRGPGVQVEGTPHARESWEVAETDSVWLKRAGAVGKAMAPAEIKAREKLSGELHELAKAPSVAHEAELAKRAQH